MTDSIHDLEKRIQKAKDNVEEIQNIMKTWVSPIFKRKDGRKECLLSMDDQQDRMEKYYSCIRDSGLKIHALVQVTSSLPDIPTTNILCREVCLGARSDLDITIIGTVSSAVMDRNLYDSIVVAGCQN